MVSLTKAVGHFKYRLYNLIRDDDENDLASNIFDGCIIGLIAINVVLVIMDTFDLPESVARISRIIETVSVVIFTTEYLARLWTSDLKRPKMHPALARLRYVVSIMALVDLFAILPFYLPFIFPFDLRVLRTLRIVRLFRLFKVSRYTNALSSIATVFRRKAHQLLTSVFVVSLLIIIASILMYNVEHDAQPDVFVNAFSGVWWAVATLTTVGYGDIYPITALGRIISGIIALLGIGLVAVPTGIMSAGFMEQISSDDTDNQKKYCPYCGHKID